MALNINGTTGISGVDGSVSAPAVTGTDSNTGITFPSADTIKFSTGGVERMSITNSGVSGGGKLLQVVEGTTTTGFGTASANYGDIGLSATITPSSSSNKVLVFGNVGGIETTADNNYTSMRLYRGGDLIISRVDYGLGFTGDSGRWGGSSSFNILDSPNTTNATTYKIQANNPAASGSIQFQMNDSRSAIILIEVAV